MKIVTVITRLIRGGAQRLALETAAFLCQQGHEAPLWCGPETGSEGSLHEEAVARGVPVRVIPSLVRRIDPVQDLLALAALTREFRRARPDWVHTHSSKAGILGREAARGASVPHIAHTVHGWGFTPATSRAVRSLFVRLERREARRLRPDRDRILFVSAADLEEGIRLRILPQGAGMLLPPGIDLEPFRSPERLAHLRGEVRGSLGWSEEQTVAAFVGRLAPQKAPGAVVEAARRLSAPHPELRWLMVGEGPLGPGLRRVVDRDPALRGRIHWTGLVADPVPYLAAADLLVLPSLWEGLPLTAMEGMAAGLPLVASALPALEALVCPSDSEGIPRPDGEADSRVPPRDVVGLLVPPGDAQALARQVGRLVQEPGRRRRLGQAARNRALHDFGRERWLSALLGIYCGGSVQMSADNHRAENAAG